ncbi:DUF4159 domain-containing protein [Pseudanabaenaceae cyanobacterium LEGE 13415]|nr:DUF4159 domain-containing protein [Pseudanabaenaceae cyanobacterium LEGE 13415]
MSRSFPPPPIIPFERLQASDGLLITAERWQRSHHYHRQRQNVHYQSLNQPGIVCGLGVRPIEAPTEVSAAYRDKFWLRVQPGIAIDLSGNLIVVPKPIAFRIATELKSSDPVTVYLVVRYRDPDELRDQKPNEFVQETFRIDEKSSPPDGSDVELCRILLQIDKKEITTPKDVFFPGFGDLDLRYRRQAQARPQGLLRIAQINHADSSCSQNFFSLSYFVQAIEALYPALRSVETIDTIDWSNDLHAYDLLYLTGQESITLNAREFKKLETYLRSGGTVLIDAATEATALIESVQELAQKLKMPLKSLDQNRRDHPLRTRPFLFAALPQTNKQRIQLLSHDGLILSIGNLASIWGLDEALELSRTTIRTAQELGVNILHYAWKRRHLTELQKDDR